MSYLLSTELCWVNTVVRFPSLIVLPIIPGLYSGMSITTACSASGSISVVLAPPRFSTFLQPDNCGYYVTVVIIKPFVIGLGTGFRNETTRNSEDTIKTPWPESASELYWPSDRRLSAKLVPTFEDKWCHVVSVTDPSARILRFLDRNHYFFFPVAPQ
jgi:hypothetical protein